ncbi:DUF421 domain-containing protein [Halobacillus litoralis]|uniref:DUF421 domain-containing protein n=1 Tax=Halobacillus litoralis TaxID=45668 RepID=UPI001CD4283C|nr:DUF421 domain-containing protein [Halobacillus litoralis]MCA0969560.1 DUF421 domain-containing protein [Halobacillus litoralis]
MEYLQITFETLFGFLALFILTKVLGKTQITQITAFDFISALVLGELVGNALYDDEIGIPKIAFAILLWGVLIYTTEVITEKFKGTRSLLEGRPSLIIRKGQIDRVALKKSNLDINQLQHLLRSKDVFSMQEVEFAVLETDGTISVLKSFPQQTSTKADLDIQEQPVPLPMAIISDGEVLWDNLEEANLNEEWLQKQLQAQHFKSPKDVLYAEFKEGSSDLFCMGF